MTENVEVTGTARANVPKKHLTAPLPQVKAALLSVAGKLEGRAEGDAVAAAFRMLAEELHNWL